MSKQNETARKDARTAGETAKRCGTCETAVHPPGGDAAWKFERPMPCMVRPDPETLQRLDAIAAERSTDTAGAFALCLADAFGQTVEPGDVSWGGLYLAIGGESQGRYRALARRWRRSIDSTASRVVAGTPPKRTARAKREPFRKGYSMSDALVAAGA